MRRVSTQFLRRRNLHAWPLRQWFPHRWALGHWWTLVVLLSCLAGSARLAEAQKSTAQAPPAPAIGLDTARQEWFFNQRRYGLGFIPDDALAKAIAQRDGVKVGKAAATDTAADAPPAITSGHWVSYGPLGINSQQTDLVSGRVNSLAIDPENPSTLYLAAAGGGVWKSTNGGRRWTPLTDQLASLASGAVAVDPFTGNVWYGTGEMNFTRDSYYGAGVYRSSDGGATWTRINPDNFLSSPTSVIYFDPRNKGTIFIGRSTALWKSTDGGQTWRVVLVGTVTDFALNPADSSVAYAALGYYSGSSSNGLYRSSDGGETWAPVSAPGLPAQSTMGRIALATAPSEPNTLYTLIANASDFKLNGLYRSLDGGNSWGRLDSLSGDIFIEDGAGQGAFNLCLAVDPLNAAVVYAGNSGLWKSSDYGTNWIDLMAAANLHEDPHQIIFDRSAPGTFYLIGDSGVWRTKDNGLSFTDLNETLSVTQFQTVGLHPSNPNSAVGGTQDNGTVLYTGGSLWDQGRPGDSGAVFFDAANPQTIYASARFQSVRRSDDGGQTFNLIATGLGATDRVQFYPPLIQDPNQAGVLLLGTYRLWRSGDRGDHWTALSGDVTGGGSATITALAVAPGASQVVYAGTSDGLVKISQDGGRNWAPAAPIPNRFVTSVVVDPQSPQRAIASVSGFGSGHVFRTSDSGASWEDLSRNLPDVPVNAVLLDAVSPDTIYIGTDIGVFVLGSSGAWAPMQDGLPNVIVLGLSQNASTGLLVAATHGRGAFAIITGGLAAAVPHLDVVANGASFEALPLAPGMSASLFGSNLTDGSTAASGPPLPPQLAGAALLVNGAAAPLFFVSASQINFQAPFGLTGPVAQVRIHNATGEASMHVPVGTAAPGIYQSGGVGSVLHGGGAPVSQANPGRAGEELVLFVTGLGAVNQTVANGVTSPFSPPAQTLSTPTVRVGGVTAETRFSGLAPGFVGLYQVNFVVPSGLSGSVTLTVEMGGNSSDSVSTFVGP